MIWARSAWCWQGKYLYRKYAKCERSSRPSWSLRPSATDKIEKSVAPTKREETPQLKITLTDEDLRPYFPDKRTTIPDAKRGVFEALDLRKKAIERQKAKAEAEKAGKGKKPPSPSR